MEMFPMFPFVQRQITISVQFRIVNYEDHFPK